MTNTARTRIASALVDAKLQGYARLIQNRYRRGDHTRLEAIRRARERLEQAQSLAIVRGWEGWASRHHFRCFRAAAAKGRKTVPSDLLIPDQTGTKLTSCFIEAGFT